MNKPAESPKASARSIQDAWRGYSPETAASMTIIARKDDPERPKSRTERHFEAKKAEFKAKHPTLADIGEKLSERSKAAKEKKAQEAESNKDKENREEDNLAASTAAGLRASTLAEADLLAAAEAKKEEESLLGEEENSEELIQHDLTEDVSGVNPEDSQRTEQENALANITDKQSIQTQHGTVRQKGNSLSSNSPKALMSVVATRNYEVFTLKKGSPQQLLECMQEGRNQGVNCVLVDEKHMASLQKQLDANPSLKKDIENEVAVQKARGAAGKEMNPSTLTAESPKQAAETMVKLSNPNDKHYNPSAAAYYNDDPGFRNNDRRESIEVLSQKHDAGEITDAQFYTAAKPMMDSMADSKDIQTYRKKDGGENAFTKAEDKFNRIENEQAINAEATAASTNTLEGTLPPLPDLPPGETMAPPVEAAQGNNAPGPQPNNNDLPDEPSLAKPLPPEPQESLNRPSKPLPEKPKDTTPEATEATTATQTTAATEPPKPEPPVWTSDSMKQVYEAKTTEAKGTALGNSMNDGSVSTEAVKNLKDNLGAEEFTKVAAVALTTPPTPSPQTQSQDQARDEPSVDDKKFQQQQNVSAVMNNLSPDQMEEVVTQVSKTANLGDGSPEEKAAQDSLEHMDKNKDDWAKQENHPADPADQSSTMGARADNTSSKSTSSSKATMQQGTSTTAQSNDDDKDKDQEEQKGQGNEEQSQTKEKSAKGGSQLSAGGIAGQFGAPPAVQKMIDFIAEKAKESSQNKQNQQNQQQPGQTQNNAPSTPSPSK